MMKLSTFWAILTGSERWCHAFKRTSCFQNIWQTMTTLKACQVSLQHCEVCLGIISGSYRPRVIQIPIIWKPSPWHWLFGDSLFITYLKISFPLQYYVFFHNNCMYVVRISQIDGQHITGLGLKAYIYQVKQSEVQHEVQRHLYPSYAILYASVKKKKKDLNVTCWLWQKMTTYFGNINNNIWIIYIYFLSDALLLSSF